MAAKKKVTSEDLNDLLHPESFESESILSTGDEQQEIPVTIDELVPWNRNPRIFRNPKYDEIKESIRIKGLKQKPGITKRPGDTHYMIESGGNTRLQILKELVEEIDEEIKQINASGNEEELKKIAGLTKKRDSFYNIKCVFTPWEELEKDTNSEVESEIELLAGHMVENELRGEMNFIERALAVTRLRKLFEEKEGKQLSGRKLAAAIKDTGWTGVNDSAISQYEYAVNSLHDFLPLAFEFGMGKPAVKRLRKYHTCVEQLWEHAEIEGKTLSGWEKIWQEALKECDGEVFDFDHLTDKIEARLAQALNCNITQITAELFRLGQKGADPADSLLNKAEETNVTPFAVPGSKVGDTSQHNNAATSQVNNGDADRFMDYEDQPGNLAELPSNRTIAAKLADIKQKADAKREGKDEYNPAAASEYEQNIASVMTGNNEWFVPKESVHYLLYAPLAHDKELITARTRDLLSGLACTAARYLIENINRLLKELKIAIADYMQLFEMKTFYPALIEIREHGAIDSATMKTLKKDTGLDEDEITSYAHFFCANCNIGYIVKTHPNVMVGTLLMMAKRDYVAGDMAFLLTKLAIQVVNKTYMYIPEANTAMEVLSARHNGQESQDIWHKGRIVEEIAERVSGFGLNERHLHILLAEDTAFGYEAFPAHREQLELLNRISYRIEEINIAMAEQDELEAQANSGTGGEA